MGNISHILRGIFIAFLYINCATAQCPDGWQIYNDYCWYFSKSLKGVDITETATFAESYCQENDGHLAIFTTPEERDWAYNQIQVFQDTDWWIGLNDFTNEGTYAWIDGTALDPAVANWKPGEPSNTGGEDCVEMWVNLPLYRGQWNDKSCDAKDNFICKRSQGTFESCENGWIDSGSNCYKVFNSELQWLEGEATCKASGGELVSITTSTEQQFVQGLVEPFFKDFWIGLSDTDNPGSLQWSSHESFSYNNLATGQTTSPTPYTGSTCVTMTVSKQYQWDSIKCSDERAFVCEKGYKATCPTSWIYLGGKCYELIVNPNRAATWTTAMEACRALGAGLLKIETPDQQKYLATALEGYYNSGAHEIWIGGSDIGHDDEFKWWDKTEITNAYWDVNMPKSTPGRYDCMAMYSGNKNNNWETSSCFLELQYICELPEGAKLPSVPVVTIDGKCNDGWRWMENNCYFFGSGEQNQVSASQYCTSLSTNGFPSFLASVLTADEMSFIHGHIQQASWIGLKKVGSSYQWIDGETLDFENWSGSATRSGECVYMHENTGLWMDAPCSQSHAFVCKSPEIKVTPYTPTPPVVDGDYEKCGGNGWFSDPASPKCYKIDIDRTRSWNDARYKCQQGGGDLVSMNSPDENSFIAGIAQELPFAANLWIGASDKLGFQDDVLDVVDDGWSWSDKSPFTYFNWNSGEPNNAGGEDCAELYLGTGKWNDLDCASFRHFACEKMGNNDNIIGVDVAQTECRSNEACCFKHLGVEKGGVVPDSALSASSVRNQNYNESRGRLNMQETILITDIGDTRIGYHGAWMPQESEQDTSWFQVDFQVHTEFKGIITQGRNGYELNNERQWVKSFKVSYSQDPFNIKKDVTNWEFISDSDGNPVIFQGNRDQDTQVTNLFPRPIIARHVRCHPLTYYDKVAMRLEYIGCRATCLYKIGMNSGYIGDDHITASQGDGKQARAPVDKAECLANSDDTGADYRGWLSKTKNGIDCQPWSSQTPQSHDRTPQNYPEAGLVGNFCRNPDGEPRPWCYTMDENVRWEFCSVPTCPPYTPTGWTPSSSTTNQWVQVMFPDYYKVSGVTTYSISSSYVKTYKVQFSDNGLSFQTYLNQNGDDHTFIGLSGPNSEYTDILREPLTTRFLRIVPQTWNSRITLQFEVNGCYADRRITCADMGNQFEEDSLTIACPGGCVEDPSSGIVYGTDTYTEASAVCPAAVHAGKLSNAHGGSVSFAKINGQNNYLGSTRNGITSITYKTSEHSLIFNGLAYRCPDNWYAWNEHCYHFSAPGMKKSWTEARADCKALGADLVSILSEAENDFVLVTIVQALNGNQVWIGLNALETLNWYEWSDGSTVTMTKWYLHQPNSDNQKCAYIYRNGGYWADGQCTNNYAYMCKKEKEHLPPVTTVFPPTDEGCDVGWRGNGNSCYWTSSDTAPYYYANQLCTEMGGAHLVSIHDHYEQAFVHALVTSSVPPSLGYTSWIGMAATNDATGAQLYYWESGEDISYTVWDQYQPDVELKCYFPFVYNGQTYYECTTAYNPVVLPGNGQTIPWCSVTPVFAIAYMFCGTGNAQGCGYMDDRTGYWSMDLCTSLRYYTCEKPRVGYTEPVRTTESPRGSCSDGWVKSDNLVECYQINEFADLSGRATWQQAHDHCTSQNADLVSIHSSVEETEIAKLVQDYGVNSYTEFWIGLNSISNTAGYSWSDGSAVSYTNWRAGEPSDHNGRENCVETQMLDYSQWNDINCDALRNWICKIGLHRNPNPPPTLPPPQGTEDGGCGEGWIHYTTSYGSDKCYKFVADDQQAWSRAETACQGFGGHLAAIHDQDENTMIFSRAAQTTAGSLWIGLRDIGGRSFNWADGTTLDYVNWGPGEPNNYLNNEDCGDIAADRGLWNDDNCGLRKAYICEKCIDCQAVEIPPTEAPTGGCPDGFVLYGNKCYYSSQSDTLQFQNASDVCQSMSAELAVINNQYEQAFLTSYLWGITENCWIGMHHRSTGTFVWVDQSPVTYTAWDGGQPDNWNDEEGCVEMWLGQQSSGRWNDANCMQEKSFACYIRRSEDFSTIPIQPNDNNCKSGYYSWGRGCYLLVTDSKIWQDASDYCKNEGNNLMSIAHVYENELIHSWFWKGELASNRLWIGMSYSISINGDQSVNTSFSWTDGWPVQYTNWAQNQPNTAQTSDSTGCVYMDNNGQWTTTGGEGGPTCQLALPFVCKYSLDGIPTEPPIREGNCDPGYKEYNEFCYYLNPGITDETSRSWFEARSECQIHGGDLASFHTDEEVSFFIASMDGAQSHNLWIGLYSNGFDGWIWSDKSAVEYTNWNDNEPNGQGNGEECVEMYPWNGAWNDVSCYEDRGYVCKKPAGYTRCNVPSALRIECGYDGITESYCVTHRGCCYDPTSITANFSGCFWAENEFPSGFPAPEQVSGLSGGAIAGIVIGVLVAVALVAGIVYYMKGSGKSFPSAPAFSTPSFKSKPSSPTNQSGGFDNPMAFDSTSTA